MNYHIKSLCHQGAIRTNNEDAIHYSTNEELGITWMIVADGMGGHNAGEVASAMLIAHIKKALDKVLLTHIPPWKSWIIEQLNTANLAIMQSAKDNIEHQGMGTTGVLLIIDNNECHIGWVGDSRAYTQKNNVLMQESSDHTMLQELVNKGAISAEVAKNANTKNLLSQAIGVQRKISVDTTTISIKSGDTIMLSTDGLHDYLTEQEISRYLAQFSAENNVCDEMINHALSNNSRDNLTIGLIKCTQ
ncbi:MAG: protein phosphatase 2C domain-containing protein [Colwellia sp.]